MLHLEKVWLGTLWSDDTSFHKKNAKLSPLTWEKVWRFASFYSRDSLKPEVLPLPKTFDWYVLHCKILETNFYARSVKIKSNLYWMDEALTYYQYHWCCIQIFEVINLQWHWSSRVTLLIIKGYITPLISLFHDRSRVIPPRPSISVGMHNGDRFSTDGQTRQTRLWTCLVRRQWMYIQGTLDAGTLKPNARFTHVQGRSNVAQTDLLVLLSQSPVLQTLYKCFF